MHADSEALSTRTQNDGTLLRRIVFSFAMSEDDDIASYEVSEDGVTWRPYDPAHDFGAQLHTRIEFALADED